MDFLVLRFCQTLPAVYPLVTLLAAAATLAFKLGRTVLVSRGDLRLTLTLGLALDLIELAVFRCVAGTSAHEASLSLAFANTINVHRRRIRIAGSDSTPRPSLSKTRSK